jgi:streptogramin lyase
VKPIRGLVALSAALALAAGASVFSSASAARASRASCAGRSTIGGHRAKVFRTSGAILIYRVRTSRQDGAGDRVFDYYACLRPHGALRYVASGAPPSYDIEYGSNLILDWLRSSGDDVLAEQSAGGVAVAECNKYQLGGPGCGAGREWARVVDLRSGRSCELSPGSYQALTSKLTGTILGCPPGSIPAGSAVKRYTKGLVTRGVQAAPTTIAAGSDGALWFTDPADTAIWRLDPATGEMTEYTHGLPAEASPQDIAAGPDGNLWFTVSSSTAERAGAIGKIDPSTGAIAVYSTGLPAGTQPDGIAAGPDGALWFTIQPQGQSAQAAIGRIDPATGAITTHTAGLRPLSSPDAITAAPDGALWFTDPGLVTVSSSGQETPTAPAVGMIDPAGGAITEYTNGLPAGGSPTAITSAPDGALWFTLAFANGMAIGRIDPTTGAITSYTAGLAPGLEPGGIAAAPGGALWFTAEESGGSAVIGRVEPTSGAITEYGIPSGSPLGILSGPDGDLWSADAGAPDFTQYGYRLAAAPPGVLRISVASLTAPS